eukprot:3437344-Pleurochrysis_carterae.AAC.1
MSPITRLNDQTPPLLQPARTSEAPAGANTPRGRATRVAPAKRAKRATQSPLAMRPARRAQHTAAV